MAEALKNQSPLSVALAGLSILTFIGNAIACQRDVPPGVVIVKSPDFRDVLIGSPSLAVLPNRDLVASHGFHGAKAKNGFTAIHKSKDGGKTWNEISKIESMCWGSLFVHNDALYMIGTRKGPGYATIRKSEDWGETWSSAHDPPLSAKLYRTETSSVSFYKGRIWRTYTLPSNDNLKLYVFSAPDDSDLLDPKSWTISNPVELPRNALGGKRDRLKTGIVLESPSGQLVCLARITAGPLDKAALIDVSDSGESIRFDLDTSIINFPGGREKFAIHFDDKSKRFWSVSNKQLQPYAKFNILTLSSSVDLRSWKTHTELLRHTDNIWHGFNQVDFHFDGDDIVTVCGNGWTGGKGAMHPIYLTFNRFKDFRSLTESDSADWLASRPPFAHETRSLSIQGKNVALGNLESGANAFSGWQLRFETVPDRFQNWNIVKTKGGSKAEIVVKAKRDQRIYMTSIVSGDIVDVTGWRVEMLEGISYSGQNKTLHPIYGKDIRRGETVTLPQGSWGGCALLVPPMSSSRHP